MVTSIIVLTHNQLDYTKRCIESIIKFTGRGSYELIIVDNHSTDGTVEWLNQQSNFKKIFNNENLGFPKGCNQGINVATGDNILLLNNDTIVTYNWLENLLACLYSSDDIGAVGPVTNSLAYYSTIPINYTSINEMQQFAKDHNITNRELWEERLKLIGYCMLFKREAIDKVGMLDERFSPGNFEDDDYSVRLRKAGYRLILCKDTFIHHFGSVSWKKEGEAFSTVLTINEKKFMDKWGTDSNSYRIETEMIEAIPFTKDQPFKILHIGCGSGATLLKVKHVYPLVQLFGIEENPFSIEEASRFASITNSIRDDIFQGEKFDVILFTESINFNESLLHFVKAHQTKNGVFISKVPNIAHHHVLQELLCGRNPIKDRQMYSLEQVDNLLKEAGYRFSIKGLTTKLNDAQSQFINQIIEITGEATRSMLESTNYLVTGELLENPLIVLLEQFSSGQNIIEELKYFSTGIVIDCVKENLLSPITILNKIAIENFASGNHDAVLPYLQAAYEEAQEDPDTLYNLAFVLNSYGEKELANEYLAQIKNPDEEVQQLFEEINDKSLKTIQELTFFLRRLEFDIDLEETKQQLIQMLLHHEIDDLLIKEVVETSNIDKIKIFQSLSITFFENELHDHVLPYLQAAYDLDPTNEDTLFNLGYILIFYGETELAEGYLNQIRNQNDEVRELLKAARGESSYE